MPMPLLVADSGPLIALARLNLLNVPGCYFESTFIAAAVWDEVTRNPKFDEMEWLQAAATGGLIKIVDEVLVPPESLQHAGVDVGEQMAIALALALPATLLVDDRRARRAAESLGVSTLGTMALLVRARKDGLTLPLKPLLELQRTTGYFLSPGLIEQVLNAVDE